jgi:hypothetical protein
MRCRHRRGRRGGRRRWHNVGRGDTKDQREDTGQDQQGTQALHEGSPFGSRASPPGRITASGPCRSWAVAHAPGCAGGALPIYTRASRTARVTTTRPASDRRGPSITHTAGRPVVLAAPARGSRLRRMTRTSCSWWWGAYQAAYLPGAAKLAAPPVPPGFPTTGKSRLAVVASSTGRIKRLGKIYDARRRSLQHLSEDDLVHPSHNPTDAGQGEEHQQGRQQGANNPHRGPHPRPTSSTGKIANSPCWCRSDGCWRSIGGGGGTRTPVPGSDRP